MDVLVTGGTGFIGRRVVADLRRAGHGVTVLTRRPVPGPFPPGVMMLRGDLASPRTLTGLREGTEFGGICHLAGLTGMGDSLARPTAYFDVNIGGSVALLKVARAWHERTGVSAAVVFASSRAVYGHTPGESIPETRPAAPVTPYG